MTNLHKHALIIDTVTPYKEQIQMPIWKHNINEKVTIPADEVLGTDAFEAIVISHESYGYIVQCADGCEGPVNFKLEILQTNC